MLFNPISIWDLGNEIDFIIKNKINEKIIHISGREEISKYDFGYKLIKNLNLDTDLRGIIN